MNRIPGDQLKNYKSWQIPRIENPDKVLPTAERQARAREKRAGEVVGESVAGSHRGGPMTADQLTEITEAAHQEGYNAGLEQGREAGQREGYQAGKAQALEETREQIRQQQERLEMLIAGLSDPFESQTETLETLVLDTVNALTASVVERELKTDSGPVRELVRKALAALPGNSDNITIYLNPDDMALLEDFTITRSPQWQLREDPQLLPGGCRVETPQSLVDFSVEARLQYLCDQFRRGELMAAVLEEDAPSQEPDEADHPSDDPSEPPHE